MRSDVVGEKSDCSGRHSRILILVWQVWARQEERAKIKAAQPKPDAAYEEALTRVTNKVPIRILRSGIKHDFDSPAIAY